MTEHLAMTMLNKLEKIRQQLNDLPARDKYTIEALSLIHQSMSVSLFELHMEHVKTLKEIEAKEKEKKRGSKK